MSAEFSESAEGALRVRYYAVDFETAEYIAGMIRAYFGSHLPETISRLDACEEGIGCESLPGDLLEGWCIHLVGVPVDDADDDRMELEVQDIGYIEKPFESFTIHVPKSFLKQGSYSRPDAVEVFITNALRRFGTKANEIAHKLAKGDIL